MRHESTATCLSWIPPAAVQGMFKLPFGLGVAHYDQPPPDELPDVGALLAADAIRFANQLHAWIEVTGGQITAHGSSGGGRLGSTTRRLRSRGLTFAGVALPDITSQPETYQDRVRFTQTAGGHTGVPVPRAVSHPPFWRLTAPVAWSTIALTLFADGSAAAEIAAASPFPATMSTAAPDSSHRRARSSGTRTGSTNPHSRTARGAAPWRTSGGRPWAARSARARSPGTPRSTLPAPTADPG